MKIRTHSKKTSKGFTLIELMVVIAILATLAGVAYGPIMERLRKGDETQALQNGKQIVLALVDFSTEMNSLPSDRTAETLQRRSPDFDFGPLTGEYSNCYFRQLFYSHLDDEGVFYGKMQTERGYTTVKPDGIIPGGKALEIGENAFAYTMMGEGRAMPTNSLNVPLIMFPIEDSAPGDRITFDGNSYKGRALVIKLDQSAEWVSMQDRDAEYTIPDLFKPDKRGRETASKYYILAPEL